MRQLGNLLILGGVIAVLAGLAARYGLFSWFGNLPGDIRRVGGRSVLSYRSRRWRWRAWC